MPLLTHTPCSFPPPCTNHRENGPNLFETHQELIRFILGPVPERLIAWLRITFVANLQPQLPSHTTGEPSSSPPPLLPLFALAGSSHPSPVAMSLQSLPLAHSRAEIASPPSQQFVLPQEELQLSTCRAAGRSCTNSTNFRSRHRTGTRSRFFSPPAEFSFCFTRQIICCDSYCFLSFAAWPGSMHHFVLRDA